MNRKEFGQLVRALRRELISMEGGSMTIEELADGSGLAATVVGNIENGAKVNLMDEVGLLARALELTNNETKEFFAAASGISNADEAALYCDPQLALIKMTNFLDRACAPAFLMDSFGDIIMINRFCLGLFEMTRDLLDQFIYDSALNFNFLAPIFAPAFRDNLFRIKDGLGLARAEEFYFNAIMLFRTLTFKHRADPYFAYMLKKMSGTYPDFRANWHMARLKDNDRFTDNIFLGLAHQEFGRISLLGTSTTAITQVGDLKLYIFSPQDLMTQNILTEIQTQTKGSGLVALLPNWPDKPYGPKS